MRIGFFATLLLIGCNGMDGATGPQGPAGAQGPPGPAGKDGQPGQPGPQGTPGAMGAMGATGAAGANGAPGPQGAQGPPGTIDYTKVIANGVMPQNASFDITGSGTAASFAVGGAPVAPLTINRDNGANQTEMARLASPNAGAISFITVGDAAGPLDAPTGSFGLFGFSGPNNTVGFSHSFKASVSIDPTGATAIAGPTPSLSMAGGGKLARMTLNQGGGAVAYQLSQNSANDQGSWDIGVNGIGQLYVGEWGTIATLYVTPYPADGMSRGKVGIGTNTPINSLGVIGNIAATGTVLGGVGNPDVAENITAADDVEAAETVAADPRGGERVLRTRHPYQTSVLGVISTKPGILTNAERADVDGGARDPRQRPIALAGRVPVKVTLEGGAIRAGDLLTTSSTPGRAMRAVEPWRGGIIGTALTGFDGRGDGKVIVFIAHAPAPSADPRLAERLADLETRLARLESKPARLARR